MKYIDTFIFDLDGTLIDTTIYKRIYPKVLKMILKKSNLSKKQIEATAKALKMKKNKYGHYDSGDLCRVFGLIDEYYALLEKEVKVTNSLHDGVESLFKKLKKDKKKIGIASNSMKKTIMLHLKKYDILKYVDFVFSSEDAGCKKDNPKYWKMLIKKEKLNPRNCLIIGDTTLDDKLVPQKLGFNSNIIKSKKDLITTDIYRI